MINTLILSQLVSLELSVVWRNNTIQLPKKVISRVKGECIPYLKVTYINNTDNDIFFLKVINNSIQLPFFSDGMQVGYLNKNETIAKFPYYSCSLEKFFVCIKGLEIIEGPWEVLSDTTFLNSNEDNYYDRFINRILRDFYFSIIKDSDIEAMEYHFSFGLEDLTDSAILKNQKEYFVFLKKGESFSEQFNLIGFYLLGGDYLFYIPDHSFVDYIFVESPQNEIIHLPLKVNEYSLYSGSFSSNKLRVKFNKKSNKKVICTNCK